MGKCAQRQVALTQALHTGAQARDFVAVLRNQGIQRLDGLRQLGQVLTLLRIQRQSVVHC